MDREKAIKGLEAMLSNYDALDEIEINKWNQMLLMHRAIAKEALALLKEQAKTKVVFGRTKDGEFVTECGNCGTHLDKAYSNCPKCKKELDWNSNQG